MLNQIINAHLVPYANIIVCRIELTAINKVKNQRKSHLSFCWK